MLNSDFAALQYRRGEEAIVPNVTDTVALDPVELVRIEPIDADVEAIILLIRKIAPWEQINLEPCPLDEIALWSRPAQAFRNFLIADDDVDF